MSTLDFEKILKDSVILLKDELGKSWKKVEPLAEHYIQQYAEDALILKTELLKGSISEEEYAFYSKIHEKSLTNIFLAIKGVGIVTSQRIVNGVIGIVEKAVLAVVGL